MGSLSGFPSNKKRNTYADSKRLETFMSFFRLRTPFYWEFSLLHFKCNKVFNMVVLFPNIVKRIFNSLFDQKNIKVFFYVTFV